MGRCKQQEHCANPSWCDITWRCLRSEAAGPVRDDGMPASADERRLRRMLALRSGIPHLYCDDGEASGQEHGISIDFLREPVADIEAKLLALNVARFRVAEGEPPNVGTKLPTEAQP